MKLKLRRLELRAQAADGLYGASIPFNDGLVLVRADNSMGKSTCFLAIIYALGLERMLSPTDKIPLPHVMTEFIEDGIPVVESKVILEISNSAGEVLTIQRQVVGDDDNRLIRTWDGPKLTEPGGAFQSAEYYVRDPGSATNESGFHYRLAKFLRWELPLVSRFNNSECLLYLEAIFPLFFVEQKHGWAGVQSNLPTFLGIREMGKRSLEFVMNLDAARLAVRRQELEQESAALKGEWRSQYTSLSESVRVTVGRVLNLSESPAAQWPPTIPPQLEVFREGAWVNIQRALLEYEDELTALEQEDVPTAEESASELDRKLAEVRDEISHLELFGNNLLDEIDADKAQLRAATLRLDALNEDMIRNRDAQRLKKYGSVGALSVSENICPTCHQHVNDVLLSQMSPRSSMSIDENIDFIHSQIRIFRRLEQNGSLAVSRKEAEMVSARERLSELRASVRAIRQTLTSQPAAPSFEAVRRRVYLSERIDFLRRSLEAFDEKMLQFEAISQRWAANQSAIRLLPRDALSDADRQKLSHLERTIRDELVEFGLKSIDADSLSISDSSYQLVREGFNLGFDLSASDNIRVIWAYLDGLLQLSSIYEMNHIGLLIFDEPGQQQVAEMSFESLLRNASGCADRGQQIVFFTSEDFLSLEAMTLGTQRSIVNFDGRVITKLS